MSVKSNASKIAGQFLAESKRVPNDFGFLIGGLVEVSAESVYDKGIARKGAIPPNQQYATVYKGRATIKSITRPVDRTGQLRATMQRFGNFVRWASQYSLTTGGMSGVVFRMGKSTVLKWKSTSAKIGALENTNISKNAKKPIPGMAPSKWPGVTSKYPRRFISRRYSPAMRALRQALGEWGSSFSSDFGKSKQPRKVRKINVGD